MFPSMPSKQQVAYFTSLVAIIACFVFIGRIWAKPAPKLEIRNLDTPEAKPATPQQSPEQLIVEVAGAVRKPGVIKLKPGSRVHDAIREAGGAKPNALLGEWNLAAKVQDGMQIYVASKSAAKSAQTKGPGTSRSSPRPNALSGNLPVHVEVPEGFRGGPIQSASVTPTAPKSGGGKKPEPAEGSISLNASSGEQLQALPGVGPSTAAKIVEYRTEHGGFTSIDELLAVKGIGPKKLEAMRRFLKL